MAHWYESSIDRQIREAQERGEFDDLPGAGKPLPGAGEVLPDAVAKKTSEQAVRAYVAELNVRIVRAHRGELAGPAVALALVDADESVRQWRARRAR